LSLLHCFTDLRTASISHMYSAYMRLDSPVTKTYCLGYLHRLSSPLFTIANDLAVVRGILKHPKANLELPFLMMRQTFRRHPTGFATSFLTVHRDDARPFAIVNNGEERRWRSFLMTYLVDMYSAYMRLDSPVTKTYCLGYLHRLSSPLFITNIKPIHSEGNCCLCFTVLPISARHRYHRPSCSESHMEVPAWRGLLSR
jgi:hypothetical protein